jgi:hypothetical protein
MNIWKKMMHVTTYRNLKIAKSSEMSVGDCLFGLQSMVLTQDVYYALRAMTTK